MATLIRDRAIASDNWLKISDEEDVPPGDVIVSLARWQREREALVRRGGGLGIRISGDNPVDSFSADLEHFDLIALEFTAFTDGRCYSHARLLRERFNFRGELRAIGDILRDQLYFLARCGVNAFELPDGKNAQEWLTAFNEISVQYQAAADNAGPLYRRRSQPVTSHALND